MAACVGELVDRIHRGRDHGRVHADPAAVRARGVPVVPDVKPKLAGVPGAHGRTAAKAGKRRLQLPSTGECP